jgi:hypothetical protein
VLALQTNSAQLFPVQGAVERLIGQWLAPQRRPRSSIQLVVAHSHSHYDHVGAYLPCPSVSLRFTLDHASLCVDRAAGDMQFVGQPYTTVVGLGQTNVAKFFGLYQWPLNVSLGCCSRPFEAARVAVLTDLVVWVQAAVFDLGQRPLTIVPIPGHAVRGIQPMLG